MIYLQRIGINTIQYEYEVKEEVDIIYKKCSIRMKGARFSKKYKAGHWDGTLKAYNKLARTFPISFLDLLLPALDRLKMPYELDMGSIVKPFRKKLLYPESFWQHQKEALNAFFLELFGIIIVPTRGGKTRMFAEALKQVQYVEPGMTALFIVDTQDLFIQAREDLAEHLGVKQKMIGSIQGDNFNIQPVTVAMIQTLLSINTPGPIAREGKTIDEIRAKRTEQRVRRIRLLQYMAQVNFLGVDECHEYTSKARIEFLEKFRKDIKRLMFSATPFRSEDPVGNFSLRKVAGRVLYTVTEQTLEERGILSRKKIVLLYINHNKNKNLKLNDESDYRTYQRQIIIENFFRNMVLVNTLEICRKMLLKVLVLFSSKQHGYLVQSITGDDFISGDNNVPERTAAKNKFLKRRGGVLYASDIFKKGITLPEAEVMCNASGGLEKVNVTQKKGRVLGATEEKKKSLIIDIIDDSKYFKDHSLNRISVYEKSVVSKTDIVVFNTADKEFYNDFRGFVSDWMER